MKKVGTTQEILEEIINPENKVFVDVEHKDLSKLSNCKELVTG